MDNSDLDLAALLCTRVCHDLVGPVGAISNGLEVLEDEDDGEMQRQAYALLGMSAEQATAKLKFYRLAFGLTGQAGEMVTVAEARGLSSALLDGGRTELSWPEPAAAASLELGQATARLLLNMVLTGAEALPRGGTLHVAISGFEPEVTVSVEANGIGAGLSDAANHALSPTATAANVEPRAAAVYLTKRLAGSLGFDLDIARGDDRLSLQNTLSVAR